MTSPRFPGSFADAMVTIAGKLTYARACEVVGLRETIVRRWSIPTDPRWPTLVQALSLDAAYIAAGGQGAPFRDAFDYQLDLTVTAATACQRALASDVAEAARESGDAIAAAILLTQPGFNPSALDCHRALTEVDQAETRFGALKRRLHSFLPIGVGPLAGNTGGSHQ